MGRPRKDSNQEETVESLNLKIEEHKLKMQKLIDKKEKIENAEYIKLGKTVKHLFADVMPNDINGQIQFFTNLANRLKTSASNQNVTNMNSEPQV
jgi:hypothetical protein